MEQLPQDFPMWPTGLSPGTGSKTASGTSWQGSTEKPKIGIAEKNQLNTQQLALSQELPERGHLVPLSRPPRDSSALVPVSKGAPVGCSACGCRRSTVQPAHSPAMAFLLDLDEVALKSGCISGTLSLVKKPSLYCLTFSWVVFTWKTNF